MAIVDARGAWPLAMKLAGFGSTPSGWFVVVESVDAGGAVVVLSGPFFSREAAVTARDVVGSRVPVPAPAWSGAPGDPGASRREELAALSGVPLGRFSRAAWIGMAIEAEGAEWWSVAASLYLRCAALGVSPAEVVMFSEKADRCDTAARAAGGK